MKKYHWITGFIALLLAGVCMILWQQKAAEHKKMEDLCQSSVQSALSYFADYRESGKSSDYVSGVAEFRSFMTSYLFLNNNTSDTEYVWCNTIYGDMVLYPEKVQADIQGLIEALTYLAEDYEDPSGFHLLGAYVNQLAHGREQ